MFKPFDNPMEAIKLMQEMSKFQLQHNKLRVDYNELLEVSGQRVKIGGNNDSFIRSCIHELFTLIESDLYFLNVINSDLDYDDFDRFIERFKDTFKHHCRTHDYDSIYLDFASHNLQDFRILKDKRDSIAHPKGGEYLVVDVTYLKKTNKIFSAYNKFISDIMTDVGVSFETNSLSEFTEAFKNSQP
jgi:hypothetical protein